MTAKHDDYPFRIPIKQYDKGIVLLQFVLGNIVFFFNQTRLKEN